MPGSGLRACAGALRGEEPQAVLPGEITEGIVRYDRRSVFGWHPGDAITNLLVQRLQQNPAFADLQYGQDWLEKFEAFVMMLRFGGAALGGFLVFAALVIVANTITTVAEALLLAKKGGADPAAVRAALMGGFAGSPILTQHAERMLSGSFEPGARSSIQLKDCRTITALADQLGLDLPIIGHVTELYRHFVEEQDGGQYDHAGIYMELARRNGMDI